MAETNAAWRTQNLGYRLFAANDLFVREKLASVQSAGFEGVTEALLSLFVNLDPSGTRVTEIAARAGLTKQTMVELIDRAEKLGTAVRNVDPADKRARIVRLTPPGTRLFQCLQRGISAAEQRFASIASDDFTREFRDRFGTYSALPLADGSIVGQTSGDRAAPAWRSGNVGRVFALASRRFSREALGRVHQRNYHEVTEVMLALFRNLDLAGTRLTDLAVRARMTKQSMRELVDRADAQGFVERRCDPADRRAKIIAFSGGGLAMLEEMRVGLAEAETDAARIVGAAFLAETKQRLSDYVASLG